MSMSYAYEETMPTPEPATKPGEIRAALDDLSDRFEHLDKTVAELRERLNPVIRSVPKDASNKVGADVPPGSPLAMEVRSFVQRVDAIIARLREYRQDLDL